MAQNVYRSVSKSRSGPSRSERARPAGLRRESRGLSDEQRRSLKRWIAVLGLLPLGLVTGLTVVEMFWRALVRLDFWRSEPLVFFMLGGAAWWLAYLGGLRPMHTYVFGHEVTHLLMARAFGGKIYDWNHGAAGGYVETDKANTWITLAPYLIPLYALGVLALFGIAALFWDLNALVTVDARLLVIDELALGLHPSLLKPLFASIRTIVGHERAAVIVNEDVRASPEFADRFYVLRDGKVGETGDTRELEAAGVGG